MLIFYNWFPYSLSLNLSIIANNNGTARGDNELGTQFLRITKFMYVLLYTIDVRGYSLAR